MIVTHDKFQSDIESALTRVPNPTLYCCNLVDSLVNQDEFSSDDVRNIGKTIVLAHYNHLFNTRLTRTDQVLFNSDQETYSSLLDSAQYMFSEQDYSEQDMYASANSVVNMLGRGVSAVGALPKKAANAVIDSVSNAAGAVGRGFKQVGDAWNNARGGETDLQRETRERKEKNKEKAGIQQSLKDSKAIVDKQRDEFRKQANQDFRTVGRSDEDYLGVRGQIKGAAEAEKKTYTVDGKTITGEELKNTLKADANARKSQNAVDKAKKELDNTSNVLVRKLGLNQNNLGDADYMKSVREGLNKSINDPNITPEKKEEVEKHLKALDRYQKQQERHAKLSTEHDTKHKSNLLSDDQRNSYNAINATRRKDAETSAAAGAKRGADYEKKLNEEVDKRMNDKANNDEEFSGHVRNVNSGGKNFYNNPPKKKEGDSNANGNNSNDNNNGGNAGGNNNPNSNNNSGGGGGGGGSTNNTEPEKKSWWSDMKGEGGGLFGFGDKTEDSEGRTGFNKWLHRSDNTTQKLAAGAAALGAGYLAYRALRGPRVQAYNHPGMVQPQYAYPPQYAQAPGYYPG